jgi:hypothetical protein
MLRTNTTGEEEKDMKRKHFLNLSLIGMTVLAVSMLPLWAAAAAVQPRVEVVFCLDTTGSMGGLIEGAKHKIWSIANQIVRGEPTPQLSIGLVGYRDYGDMYVTRVHHLSEDLDRVYENLMSFRADGGGDTPEHVNRALHDAVHGIAWSEDEETLRLIFLVGDCPPHMDYDDGFDYREICMEAVSRDIIVNTVQCGDYLQTTFVWRDIAARGEGRYAAVAQEGGMSIVETPFDEQLALLNARLEDTVVPFGSASRRTELVHRREKVKEMAPHMAAERAAYKSADTHMGAFDLVDALRSGSVRLEELKDKELPEELQGMNMEQRRSYLAGIEREREAIMAEIDFLSGERASFIEKHLSEHSDGGDAFDEVVQDFIEEQAADRGIRYR